MHKTDPAADPGPRRLSRSLELAFRIRNRRTMLIGLWAAERCGLHGSDADAYAAGICAFASHEASDAALIARLRADLDHAGKTISDSVVRGEVDRCADLAALELGGFDGA